MKYLVIVVTGIVGFLILKPSGTDSESGSAEFFLRGENYQLEHIEFRVEVNPVLGSTDQKNLIESGHPQPIRYMLRTSARSDKVGVEAISFTWWARGDDPMAELQALVGERLRYNPGDDRNFVGRIFAAGRKFRVRDDHDSWLQIDNIRDGVITGTFGGDFEVEVENLTIDNLTDEPEMTTITQGYFKVPIKQLFEKR